MADSADDRAKSLSIRGVSAPGAQATEQQRAKSQENLVYKRQKVRDDQIHHKYRGGQREQLGIFEPPRRVPDDPVNRRLHLTPIMTGAG